MPFTSTEDSGLFCKKYIKYFLFFNFCILILGNKLKPILLK